MAEMRYEIGILFLAWDRETGACLKTIPLLWVPCEIKAHPHKPGIFATANANGTVTFYDFEKILGISKK